MFSKILKSAARKSLLEIFLNDSRQKYYLRELAAMIQYSPGSLQRELNSLVEDDLLLAEKMGNLRFFSLNVKSPYVKELRQYLLAHPQPVALPKAASEQAKRTSLTVKKQPKPKEQSNQPKPVLERRPVPQAEPASEIVTSRPPVPMSTPVPVPAPIHPTDGYTSSNSPFSKPVLSKPHLEKPTLNTPDSKLNQSHDYPATQSPVGFQYVVPQHVGHDAPESLSYTPEPATTQSTTQQKPPDESSEDIRLHID